MQTTEYFELNIVEGSDLVNPLTQQNPNFEKIDEQMFKNQNSGVCLATELKTASVHAINRTVPDCAMFRFTATSDFVSGDTFTVDGVQVTAKLTNGQPLGTGAFVINSEVIGVLVGTLVTFYVESGVVPTASDSERLGGELPSYYAKKTEVDQAQSLAESVSVLAQNNQNSIADIYSKEPKILWENNNKNSLFPQQPISLLNNITNYKAIEIIFSGVGWVFPKTIKLFVSDMLLINGASVSDVRYDGTVYYWQRTMTFDVPNNTISFTDCTLNNSSTANDKCVPIAIIGHKY